MTQSLPELGAELTREQIQAVINQKLENTIYWLNKAYDARPQDNIVEKTLLELMAALQRLKFEADAALKPKTRVAHPSRRRQPRDHFKIVPS